MKRRSLRIDLLCTGVLLAACSRGAGGAALLEIPPPAALDTLSPDSRREYELRRAALDALLASGERDAARLGHAFGALGQWYDANTLKGEAQACYRNALVFAPEEPRWHYYLGHLAYAQGQVAEARASFQKTLALEPDCLAARVWLAELERTDGARATADELYHAALKSDPGCVVAWVGLGQLALSQGNAREACEHFERAFAIQPDCSAVRYSLGSAYRSLGELERARALLEPLPEVGQEDEMILRDPYRVELTQILVSLTDLEARAAKAMKTKNFARAERLFRQILEKDPGHGPARLGLATALQAEGRTADARKELGVLLEREPQNADARRLLEQLGKGN